MTTEKNIYLNHIRRLKNTISTLAEAIADERSNRENISCKYSKENADLRKHLESFTGEKDVSVSFRRRGETFFFTIDEKEIAVISTHSGGPFGLKYEGIDFSVVDLSFAEIKAIKNKLPVLLEELELWVACPTDEYTLQNCDLSKREFTKILNWWAIYDNEKKLIQHLYNLKYDHSYRQQHEAAKRAKAAQEAESRRKTQTYIYLMKDAQTNYYKIGQSRNPQARESTLFSEKPSISLVIAWEASSKEEKELHHKFIEKQVRGEWFDLSESDIREIYEFFKDRTVFESK